jgi:hypothetical protein
MERPIHELIPESLKDRLTAPIFSWNLIHTEIESNGEELLSLIENILDDFYIDRR